MNLEDYVPRHIWRCRYPVNDMGIEFDVRMTIIRLLDGKLMLHSPCEIDGDMKLTLSGLGEDAYIVAPETYHYLHKPSAQAAYPQAKPSFARDRTQMPRWKF